MNVIEQLIEELERSRERILIALADLPDEALTVPGAVNGRSIADVLAILTAWEAEMVTGLLRLDQGRKPGKLLAALDDPAAYEARRQEETAGRDLDRMFADWHQVRLQLMDWLEEFSEKDLAKHGRYRWFQGKPLRQIIAETSYERERRVLPQIESFAREWPAGGQTAPPHDVTTEDDNDNAN
jgi:hypothetical protein